jgi:hypothetical protein
VSTQRFPLHTPRALYWWTPLFGLVAVLSVVFFVTQDRGLVILRAIHLDVTEARVLFAVCAVLSTAAVVISIVTLRSMRGGRIAIELDDEAIVVPGPVLRSRSRRFRFAELTRAKVHALGGHELLTLVGPPGRRSIARSELGPEAFDAIVAHVLARVPAPRSSLPVAKVH